MSTLHFDRHPYKNRMVDLSSCYSSLVDETNPTTLPNINKSIRNNVIVDYFNDVLYSRKAVQTVFLNKKNEMFAENDALEYLLLNFAGLRNDVAYNLKTRTFVKYEENVNHLLTAKELTNTRYFLKMVNTWEADGIQEKDVDIAGDVAHKFIQTLFHLIQNTEMDDEDFKCLFKK